MHHTHTNILGKDRDIGYGVLRMSEDQPWHPYYLGNPVYATLLALFFQYGRRAARPRGRADRGRRDHRGGEARRCCRAIWKKVRRQALKDYVLFPLLAGPVGAARRWPATRPRTWPATCGRSRSSSAATSPTGRDEFTEEETEDETRGEWYYRQLLGSANLTGGQLFHVMSGNLSHQIEHHLFPDLPAHRYAEIAVEVREICERYGLPYNSGPAGQAVRQRRAQDRPAGAARRQARATRRRPLRGASRGDR